MWPNLSFDADLLYRLKAKAKQKVFGADKDAINAFMRKGKQIMDESGIFEITFEENMKIETVLIQTSAMRAYANQYDDFTILDGKFSMCCSPASVLFQAYFDPRDSKRPRARLHRFG